MKKGKKRLGMLSYAWILYITSWMKEVSVKFHHRQIKSSVPNTMVFKNFKMSQILNKVLSINMCSLYLII